MDGITMKQHKHAEIIKAWADGAEIQVRGKGEWFDALNPTFSNPFEYRVKPKKWTPKYRLVAAEIDDNSSYSSYKNVAGAVKNYWTLNKFVEEFETDWDNQCCEVFKSSISGFTVLNMKGETRPSLGVIRMSKQCAKKLCEMLNSGEVELNTGEIEL